jgi:hypothetical protein
MSGGSGILGSIGSLFGFGGAVGGSTQGASQQNPLFVYDIAGGGAGGRVFGGATGGGGSVFGGGGGGVSGIFDNVKNVFGGIANTVGNVFGGIADTVGSIFGGGGGGGGGGFLDSITSTIGDFFGGFFANGGTLGAGKFGIAGENGPEFIGGPATITPMGGGSVTYNINAVDAASFKALVAADPGFIHAVAQMGGRSVPSRR